MSLKLGKRDSIVPSQLNAILKKTFCAVVVLSQSLSFLCSITQQE